MLDLPPGKRLPDASGIPITLGELLRLVGPVGDGSGFKTPRERFRRVILEHITTVAALRASVEACLHTLDDQQQRALEDLVVVIGRAPGFEPRFESVVPGSDAAASASLWRSPTGLDILLEVRTAQSTAADVTHLSQSVEARVGPTSPGRALGLSLTTPLFSRPHDLERLAAASTAPIRIVSVPAGPAKRVAPGVCVAHHTARRRNARRVPRSARYQPRHRPQRSRSTRTGVTRSPLTSVARFHVPS